MRSKIKMLAVFSLLFFSFSSLQAKEQKQDSCVVLQPLPSHFVLLKHNKYDSLQHLQPSFEALYKRLRNRHLDDPALRYSIQNLKNDNKYAELQGSLDELIEYAENQNIKLMLEQVRRYFDGMEQKEKARLDIQQYVHQDSIRYGKEVLLLEHQDLVTLLNYIENDPDYLWMQELTRDSVQVTIIDSYNMPTEIWLNTGKARHYRFAVENFRGDTINTWMHVLPNDKAIKINQTETVFPMRRGVRTQRKEKIIYLDYPEEMKYGELVEVKKGNLKRNYWTYYSDITLSFGQGYQSKNWAKGGENSLSLLSDFKYFINYTKNSLTWENSFRYRLGALKSGSEKMSKNEDKLEIVSKLGHKAFKHWNYAAQFDFNTVLFKGFNYPGRDQVVANLLSPAYFTLSIGFDYKPKETISLYFSPIAGKWTYVRDTAQVNPTRYGVEAGKQIKQSAGAKIDFKTKHKIFDFLNADQRLIAFAGYYDDPVNVEWQLALGFNISYFMKTSVNLNALYDKNSSKKIQFKETMTLDVYFRF